MPKKEIIHMEAWKRTGVETVELFWQDGSSFTVSYKDFNRAFGTMINGNKDEIRRDFAIV